MAHEKYGRGPPPSFVWSPQRLGGTWGPEGPGAKVKHKEETAEEFVSMFSNAADYNADLKVGLAPVHCSRLCQGASAL